MTSTATPARRRLAREPLAAVGFDPAAATAVVDPHPALHALRAQTPVAWSPTLGGWILTRYDDVRTVLMDYRRFSSDRMRPFFGHLDPARRATVAHLERYVTPWAVFNDPPVHTRVRTILNRTFIPRVEGMTPRIRAIVADLLAGLEGRADFDVIANFAYPLPAAVIMTMMGTPLADIASMRIWSDALAEFIGSGLLAPDKYARADAATAAMADYFAAMIAERRRAPRDDLLSDLMQPGDDGTRIADDELVATAILMLFAGHETTTNLVTNGLSELLRHPAQLALLRADAGLAPSTVEEVLRYQGPTAAMTRIVREDLELGGVPLRAGDRVYAMINAANRDPARFPDPDRFDIRRNPQGILTFGAGIHLCVGAPLARLEAQIALPALLARCPGLRALEPERDWHVSVVLRGLRRFRVATR
ncbi:MAG: cytochrome P450 [Alphaproteobacteria bacterium]|nr:cytochrome P450 [Alphaproteobacteria bacterium]